MRILLADDDRVFQLLLARMLPKWGYQPIVVSNGEEAWQQLRDVDGPGIAILDWVMPLADGLEVCRRVRSANLARYVYLILLTGKGTSDDVMSGLEAGADDYVSKPVSLNELRLRLLAGCRVLESEERYRQIAENASDGIVTVEEGNRIIFANGAAGAIFGYPPAELVGMDFALLSSGFERYLITGCIDGAAGTRSGDLIEAVGLHRSGRKISIEVSFSESRNRQRGRVWTIVVRDVTERRRSEGQRTQAQKLESIGQLASGIAHEINTPIQYIGDNLRFIQESWNTLGGAWREYRHVDASAKSGTIDASMISVPPSIEEPADFEYFDREVPSAIAEALEGVQRVADIVRAMKEFAHPGGVEMTPTDLNHLIETTAIVTRNRWKYIADLKTELDPALPLVDCVAGELSQVFLNLIVNAADAITDALRQSPGTRGVITIVTRAMDGFAEVRVCDSGTGIPPEVRHRIFDPFFTTKDVGKGSGQGLTLAYATVVQKHHGTIDFETTLGVGTAFVVRLPIGLSESGRQ